MKKICIVYSKYNEKFTTKLLDGAKKELKESNYKFEVVEVPGAFEIPSVISKLVKKYSDFVALGCIIKGETLNFELICNAITNGIMEISIKEKKPIGNGILTCFSEKQAYDRTNKGQEAAEAILKVLKNLP